jgi:hypothetical protein
VTSFSEGDTVEPRERPVCLGGRICRVDDAKGIYIDLGSAEGVQVGDTFSISRLGKGVGRIRVTETHDHWSVTQPAEKAAAPLEKGDFVERVP